VLSVLEGKTLCEGRSDRAMYCDDNILSHVMLLVQQACRTEHGTMHRHRCSVVFEQVSWA
jgi:hypothetical protein